MANKTCKEGIYMVDNGNLLNYNTFKDLKRKRVELLISNIDTVEELVMIPEKIIKEARVSLDQFIDELDATSEFGYSLNDLLDD